VYGVLPSLRDDNLLGPSAGANNLDCSLSAARISRWRRDRETIPSAAI